MESPEVNIKPTISADEIPDKSLLTIPGKLKQSRYEDVWPEDVHAAFMEAVSLYPPMGKRRLKYYRVSTHENEHFSDANRAKSFGRCQLIQSYILEKTGKNRSRKQVSSHLQRLKKIHKDNPAMQPLFSERSQTPSGHCSPPQVVVTSSDGPLTDTSVGARHLKCDPDLAANLQNTDFSAVGSSIFSYTSQASSLNGNASSALNLSEDFQDQPFYSPQQLLSSVTQQCPAGSLHPCNSDYLQDTLLFKDAMNEGLRSGSLFNTSAFSISMRCLASKFPMQTRLMDSSPTTHFSRVANSPGFQPTYQWISHDGSVDKVSCSSPLTSAQEGFHTPFLPFQLATSERRLDSSPTSEWIWPRNPDVPLDPREGTLNEPRLRFPLTMYEYDSTCAGLRVNTPGSQGSSSESKVARGILYPYSIASPATVSESVSNKSTIEFVGLSPAPESADNLALPLVIKPTPVYPISYVHLDNHTSLLP